HQNWLGVLNLWGPRGVAVNGPTIAVGQTPPRLEAHHPSVIKHQDAGPVGLGGRDHRIDSGLKEVGRLPSMSHQIGNAVQGVKRHWPLVSRKYSRPSTTTSLTASQRTSRTRAAQGRPGAPAANHGHGAWVGAGHARRAVLVGHVPRARLSALDECSGSPLPIGEYRDSADRLGKEESGAASRLTRFSVT